MKSLSFVTTIARLAVLALLLPAGMLAAQNSDSANVSRLLNEVRSHAALADDDAHTLASYALADIHWRTHGAKLTQIKEHVNDLIRDSNQLVTMREEGSPWQQEAIDGISSLLPEMAANLTATINHLSQNPNQTMLQPYRDLAKNNETIIHKAHEIIADYVEYGEVKAKSDALERKLQMPAASEPGF